MTGGTVEKGGVIPVKIGISKMDEAIPMVSPGYRGPHHDTKRVPLSYPSVTTGFVTPMDER